MHIPPYAKRGEVARRAGGVMSNSRDASDPSVRFADTSLSKTMGRRSYLTAEQAGALRHGNAFSSLREAWGGGPQGRRGHEHSPDASDPSVRFADTSPSKTMG